MASLVLLKRMQSCFLNCHNTVHFSYLHVNQSKIYVKSNTVMSIFFIILHALLFLSQTLPSSFVKVLLFFLYQGRSQRKNMTLAMHVVKFSSQVFGSVLPFQLKKKTEKKVAEARVGLILAMALYMLLSSLIAILIRANQ